MGRMGHKPNSDSTLIQGVSVIAEPKCSADQVERGVWKINSTKTANSTGVETLHSETEWLYRIGMHNALTHRHIHLSPTTWAVSHSMPGDSASWAPSHFLCV